MSISKRTFVLALPILLALGCSSFVRPLPYTLVTAAGTSLRVYTVNASSGALSEVAGSPVTVSAPSSLNVSPDFLFAVSVSGTENKVEVIPIAKGTAVPGARVSTDYSGPTGACISRDSRTLFRQNFSLGTDFLTLNSDGTTTGPQTLTSDDGNGCLADVLGRGFFMITGGNCLNYSRVTAPGTASYNAALYCGSGNTGPLTQSASGSEVLAATASGIEVLSFDGTTIALRSSLTTTTPTAIARVGSHYATSVGTTVRFYSLANGSLVLQGTFTHSATINSLSSDPSGTFLAVGDSGGVTVYRATSAPSLTSVATKSFGATTYAVIGYGDPRNAN